MNMDFCFVIGSGSGTVGKQTVLCLKSIRYFHPDVPVYIGCPTTEQVPDFVSEHATAVFSLEYPLEAYPISHKVGTLAAVQANTDEACYVLLDADTVLVEELLVPSFDGIAACPEHYVASHWTQMPTEAWQRLCDRYGFELPDKRIRAPLNNAPMIPYYNAGVVMVREEGFGETWLALTKRLYEDAIPHRWTADQVSLALLGFDREITRLPMAYNWPVSAHVPCLTNALILHYQRPQGLLTALDKQEPLKKMGVRSALPFGYTDYRFARLLFYVTGKHTVFLARSRRLNRLFGLERSRDEYDERWDCP